MDVAISVYLEAAKEARLKGEAEAQAKERDMVANSIGAGLAKLAAKDLVSRITDNMPEAYHRLQQDFNAALAQLESAMADIANSAHTIGSTTQEIATAADDMSKRTEQQAASLEQTSAALEEVTVTVKKTAEGAAHATAIIGTTKSEAETSGEIVHRAVDAMGRIEKSSREISQIVGVIDEIAFQTNLLALNAGVEAARAGDAGRGFAVVAFEVRALAQRSAEAAKEIKALISASTSEVKQGVELVDQTGKALEKIVGQVADINRVIMEIANGTREQATALAEVNVAVGQLDQNTQKNAAMFEETTAATHSLRRETEARGIGARFPHHRTQGFAWPTTQVRAARRPQTCLAHRRCRRRAQTRSRGRARRLGGILMTDKNISVQTGGEPVKFIVFDAGGQRFCIDTMSVREIRGWIAASPLPFSQDFLRGVINLRGNVLPIIDLAARLEFPVSEPTMRHVIIVAELPGQIVAFLQKPYRKSSKSCPMLFSRRPTSLRPWQRISCAA
jgi:methyl-accepting chemotaxis protein